MRAIIIIILSLCSFLAFSQSDIRLKGRIVERGTSLGIPFASVIVENSNEGVATDSLGFFELQLLPGTYKLKIASVGYRTFFQSVKLLKDVNIKFKMSVDVNELDNVLVQAKGEESLVKQEVGKTTLDVESIERLPYLLGEIDPVKTLQLTPGVQSASEGSSGFYVRGGGPDQNLILLDEVAIYNPSHLMGFFSTFNGDMISSVELLKAGIPANYGERLSSVMKINLKEGSDQAYKVGGGIGLVASRLMIQGPIKKNKGAVIASFRRTYLDLLRPLASLSSTNTSAFYQATGYFFYDANIKANYRITDKDEVSFHAYWGRDKFKLNNEDNGLDNLMQWGNEVMGTQWIHRFNSHWQLETFVSRSAYDFQFDANQGDFLFGIYSGLKDRSVKMQVRNVQGDKHELISGIHYTRHTFRPSKINVSLGETDLAVGGDYFLNSNEISAFVQENYKVDERLLLSAGLRYSFFEQVGPYEELQEKGIGQDPDTIYHQKNETVNINRNVEPRFSFTYLLDDQSSIKGSYTKNYQYIHLVPIAAVSLPSDIWFPSSINVDPQEGQQLSLGYFTEIKKYFLEASVEGYYKKMSNQVELASGFIELFNGTSIEDALVFGDARSYGVEFFLKKPKGQWTGWIGYTLSKTDRQFDAINQGLVYAAKYDRRSDISIVANYDISERWRASAVFVYASGKALTLPSGRYVIQGKVINEYGEPNGFRMPAYHRMDLSATYTLKETNSYQSTLSFSIYNVYNRANPYFIYFETLGSIDNYDIEVNAKQVTLFPILPSISWNFNFK